MLVVVLAKLPEDKKNVLDCKMGYGTIMMILDQRILAARSLQQKLFLRLSMCHYSRIQNCFKIDRFYINFRGLPLNLENELIYAKYGQKVRIEEHTM